MPSAYAELHAHSFFSLLDGASSPEALVAQSQALGFEHLALTDHNSLAGAMRFWKAARGTGIHPIFGAEVNVMDRDDHFKQSEGSMHLTLLAENLVGYASLC